MSGEQGAASILLLGVAGVVLLLTLAVADAGIVLSARLNAAAAADAAALAAAPVTFRPFGAAGTPAEEAGRVAAANGAVLTRCSCAVDRSWYPRFVDVEVEQRVELFGVGAFTVRASSRAEFVPAMLLDDAR